ncbi:MAG: L-rhamnose mutarotase [Lentisphaerae bacterium]|nr:L-rhamnose mutarotase [Lentisphaerota bacterium]
MKRYGRLITLKDGAGLKYDRAHANVNREIIAALSKSGVKNYIIFRSGKTLFSYFELPDEVTARMFTEKWMTNHACVKWEMRMSEFFESGCGDWIEMKEVFHFE